MDDYTPEQIRAVKEAFNEFAKHLELMGDYADAADHWAWEYRYADEVSEYRTEWLNKHIADPKS